MANWDNLKSAVRATIKENNNQEITGQALQNVLINIISNFGDNIVYAGEAIPTTNPGTPDGPVFYFAFEPGTYVNFSGITVTDEALMLTWNNGSWSSRPLGFASADYVREEFAKTPYTTDGEESDLDVSDEEGNVILRLKDGHLYVQKFRSDTTLSTNTLQIRTEFSDDESGNRELRLFLVGYNSEGELQEYGPYSLPYATEESEGTMSAEDKRHLERLDTTDGEESEFQISDEFGNVITIFKNGHIQTQKFNSEIDGQTSVVNGEDADFDISDEQGNAIARFSGGEFQTKNFYSMKTPAQMDDNGAADFQIADESGNVILLLKDGHIYAKNFRSDVGNDVKPAYVSNKKLHLNSGEAKVVTTNDGKKLLIVLGYVDNSTLIL